MKNIRTEKHLNTTIEELIVIMDNKLIEDRQYKHCMGCGIVFDDENYKEPLVDIYKLTGIKSLPFPIKRYDITTGICNPCYDIINNEYRTLPKQT